MKTEKEFEKEFPKWVDGCYCGFYCPDGWTELVWDLTIKIRDILKTHKIPEDKFVLAQVKEKFGGLRYYYDLDASKSVHKKIDDLIVEAENKSLQTCEICGEPGHTRPGGWLTTFCDKCNKSHEERKAKRLADWKANKKLD